MDRRARVEFGHDALQELETGHPLEPWMHLQQVGVPVSVRPTHCLTPGCGRELVQPKRGKREYCVVCARVRFRQRQTRTLRAWYERNREYHLARMRARNAKEQTRSVTGAASTPTRPSPEGAHRVVRDPCALRNPDCPYRATCEREASSLARARAGSRADFDALYDHYFAKLYRVSGERVGSRALTEVHARELLQRALCAPAPTDECAAERLLRLVKQFGTNRNGRATLGLT